MRVARPYLRFRVPKWIVQVFVALVGILVGIFLMVGDEVIGVVNPSRQLKMTWPLGLQFTIWQSWEIVFVVILACTIVYITLIEYLLIGINEARP